MFNIDTLRNGANLKKSKSLLRIANNGQEKMYNYLSGIDVDSTYGADNVKYILEMQGDIDWSRISDKTNALFSIGYSDQGNIIGILTNTNALLQDMLIYSSLEEAKINLQTVLTLGVGSKKIIGKRYAVNGQSPLTFSLPVVTKGGYGTYATVIHKHHSERFREILESIDLDALTEEDMKLIANDLSFLSRTQELAIDVAKDKTIEIVDTSEWLEMGVKPANYHLAKQTNSATGWYAEDNINEIIEAKKNNTQLPEFKISDVTPEAVKEKVLREVVTSESLSRAVLTQAVTDYFNSDFKEMLLYSQETALNQKAKASALEKDKISQAIRQVIIAYRSYMIDNIPRETSNDTETNLVLSKITREKLAKFASICRNTIYKIGETAGLNAYNIALTAYGTDLVHVSQEGKFFRAIMPEEFKKLYAAGKTSIEKEKLFFVDDFVKDMMDDGEEYIVDFKEGKAFDENGILIAKASYKYNATNAKIVLDEVSGRYYAETELGISLPPVGQEILVLTSDIDEDFAKEVNESTNGIDIEYTPKSPNNKNVIYTRINDEILVLGTLGYRSSLANHYQYALINNKNINAMAIKNKYNEIDVILNDFNRVNHYGLTSTLNFKEVICVNKNTDFETYYAIVTIK